MLTDGIMMQKLHNYIKIKIMLLVCVLQASHVCVSTRICLKCAYTALPAGTNADIHVGAVLICALNVGI